MTYEFTDSDDVHLVVGTNTLRLTQSYGDEIIAWLPKDDEQKHKLTEAIHGKKIAAIVYEDELPEVTELPDEADSLGNIPAQIGRTRYWLGENARQYLDWAMENIAAARLTEARDAAAKEAESEFEKRRVAWTELWLRGPATPEESVNDWPEFLAKLGVDVPETA